MMLELNEYGENVPQKGTVISKGITVWWCSPAGGHFGGRRWTSWCWWFSC
jgi:hypothetical protein